MAWGMFLMYGEGCARTVFFFFSKQGGVKGFSSRSWTDCLPSLSLCSILYFLLPSTVIFHRYCSSKLATVPPPLPWLHKIFLTLIPIILHLLMQETIVFTKGHVASDVSSWFLTYDILINVQSVHITTMTATNFKASARGKSKSKSLTKNKFQCCV